MLRTVFIEGTYLVASILFILGLRSLTRTEQAQRGMQQAALGMLLAIIGTLVNHSIIQYQWIVVGLVVGSVIGYPLGMWVPIDIDAAGDRDLPFVRGAGGDAGGGGRVLQRGWSRQSGAHDGAGLRDDAGLAHGHGQLHGLRQAAGDRHRPTGHLPRAERVQCRTVHSHGRDLH